MKLTPVGLPGMYLIEATWRGDERGRFGKLFSRPVLAEHGLDFDLVDINMSETPIVGTVRGLHYQIAPHEETKIFSCATGAFLDVCVDLRPDSASYGEWYGHELRPDQSALWIPPGIAHGFQTLAPDTTAVYASSAAWAPDAERGVRWNDPALGIDWLLGPGDPLSAKDRVWPDIELNSGGGQP